MRPARSLNSFSRFPMPESLRTERVQYSPHGVYEGACASYPDGVHSAVMTLLDYLKEAGETVSAFATRIGEAETTIKKIAYAQRQPSLALAVKITSATGGQVTAGDMVIPPAEQAA